MEKEKSHNDDSFCGLIVRDQDQLTPRMGLFLPFLKSNVLAYNSWEISLDESLMVITEVLL